ncbi:hypothetical protein GCM10020219_060220 [Nonomuraea dietziae]
MIAERFGALPETTDGSGNPQAISTEDTIMLRRIFVGAAIASTIFAGTSAAYADYNKPEKDKEVECNQTNSNGGPRSHPQPAAQPEQQPGQRQRPGDPEPAVRVVRGPGLV